MNEETNVVDWVEFIQAMKETFRLIRKIELIYFADAIILLTNRIIITNIKLKG